MAGARATYRRGSARDGGEDVARARPAAALLPTYPGVPSIYYGEVKTFFYEPSNAQLSFLTARSTSVGSTISSPWSITQRVASASAVPVSAPLSTSPG